jgi:hypothetical protein
MLHSLRCHALSRSKRNATLTTRGKVALLMIVILLMIVSTVLVAILIVIANTHRADARLKCHATICQLTRTAGLRPEFIGVPNRASSARY